MTAKPTITRFAPSPTGYIHVGNLRTALMNYLITRKAGGTFILRLDDTDQERSKQEYADGIMADLEWLGLHWDRVEKQSLRMDRYREAADDLRAKGRFYECFETPVELDLKRKKQLNMGKPPVYDRSSLRLSEDERAAMRAEGRAGYWRFRLDQERIEWVDGIVGPLSIDAASVSDPVLIRADGQVLYTFASSVDDVDMGVSFIVRGADHVTNTATQIQIMQAMGGTAAIFIGLSAYALTTKKDFSFMGGFLMVGILLAFLAGLAAIFFEIPALSLTVSAAFVLLMSGLILYETSNIIHGGETNYVLATVTLFVSIFNLFTSLLQLLGFMGGDD